MHPSTPKLIEFPKIHDARGNLSFLEHGKGLPFEIGRTYWVFDVPGGQVRGGHAYRTLDEVVIALSGSFDLVVDDGEGAEQSFHLNRSYRGLFVPAMHWRQMRHFSTNAVALVLASGPYDPSDYIRDYDAFRRELRD